MKRLSNLTNISFCSVLLAAAILYGCGRERTKKDFLARVDDSYLSKEDLALDYNTGTIQASRKNEYIRNWVETELFYQEALKNDITDEKIYNHTLNRSKKELAKAFLIDKILSETEIEYKPEELEEYYNSRKEEFRLFYDSYHYNSITFNDEDKAILFRSTLLESDWNRTSNVFHGDKSIVSEKTGIFQGDFQIQPYPVFAVIQELLPGETSIVLNTDPSHYTVFQLIRKYEKDEIPAFDVIKDRVEERFLMEKRRNIIRQYTKDLYSKYKVEIK